MDLLLSEELLLLGLDDESGKPSWSFDASMLHAALLLDLVQTGCVRLQDDTVLVTVRVPEHPLLRAARDVIAAERKVRTVAHWHRMLPYALKDLPRRAAERLVADGVLAEREDRVLGLFRTTRLPEADPGPERALRARLHAVLVDGAQPADHDTLLVALLASGHGVDHVFGDDDRATRRAAKRRATELATAVREDPAFRARHDAALIAAATVVVTTVDASGGGA